jgi:hypothetical protein
MTFEIALTKDSNKLAFRGAMSHEGGATPQIDLLQNHMNGVDEIDMTQVSSWDYPALGRLLRVIAEAGGPVHFIVSPNDPCLRLALTLLEERHEKHEDYSYRA